MSIQKQINALLEQREAMLQELGGNMYVWTDNCYTYDDMRENNFYGSVKIKYTRKYDRFGACADSVIKRFFCRLAHGNESCGHEDFIKTKTSLKSHAKKVRRLVTEIGKIVEINCHVNRFEAVIKLRADINDFDTFWAMRDIINEFNKLVDTRVTRGEDDDEIILNVS